MPDSRAVNILLKHFWSASGWTRHPSTSATDLQYAKEKEVMFDAQSFSHDESVRWACESVSLVDKEQVTLAFLASLSSRRLDMRSALGSFAIGRKLPNHSFARTQGNNLCPFCGCYDSTNSEDLSVLSFERFKWGGVRHNDPTYIGFDLAQFRKIEPVKPIDHDESILRDLLDIARRVPTKKRANELQKAWSGCLPSSKDERVVLMQILGYCGILQPAGWPSFLHGFVPCGQRDNHPRDTELEFPVSSWTGKDGVNDLAVNFWFGADFNK